MKILKRNQIIISVLALMLITVGYMTYNSNATGTVETGALMNTETMAGIGDAKLVNSNNAVEKNDKSDQNDSNKGNTATENEKKNTDKETEETQPISSISTNSEESTKNELHTEDNQSSLSTETTTANVYGADYFVASRLERDKMYSQMLETYESLAENSDISPEQKNASTQEITNINSKKNAIMITENLIKNLGFEDVVVFVNENSTTVIVKAENLTDADIAKIQNIVCREIGVDVESIHISLK